MVAFLFTICCWEMTGGQVRPTIDCVSTYQVFRTVRSVQTDLDNRKVLSPIEKYRKQVNPDTVRFRIRIKSDIGFMALRSSF